MLPQWSLGTGDWYSGGLPDQEEFTCILMSRSHQIESVFFFIDEFVSHNDFHDGSSSPSNLYDDVGDGHNLHSDVCVWTHGAHHQEVVIYPNGTALLPAAIFSR